MIRSLLAFLLLLVPDPLAAADEPEPAPRPAGVTAFRGLVVDQASVRLTFAVDPAVAKRLIVRKLDCVAIVARQVKRTMVEALQREDAAVIHDGPPPNLAEGVAILVDEAVEPDHRYAYWVATAEDGPWWGPVLLKVRHPDTWWSLERIDAQLDDLAKRFPELAKVVSLGKTYRGMDIRAIVIGKPGPVFSTTGNIHAGEFGASYLPEVARRLLEKDAELLGRVRFVAVPVVNREKYASIIRGFPAYTRKSFGPELELDYTAGFPPWFDGWVGEHQGTGVDLNRNFPRFWDTVGESYNQRTDNPRAATYRGPEPFSEPEAKAVKLLFETYEPKVHIDLHEARGGLLLGHTEDRALVERATSLGHAYLTGFFVERDKVPRAWVKLGPQPKDMWPGSVGHYGTGRGIPTFTSEGHWKLDKRIHERFCKTDTQTPEDVAALQERHYRATRAVLRLLASEVE